MLSTLLSVILAINELMASNLGEAMSPATNFDSWIELYNPSDQTVNLAGMYLSDNIENLKRWQMPDDIGSVPAKGYKVVWLGSNDIKNTQAPFKLDCDGGVIYLSDSSGNLITSQTYPEAKSHTAYARKTDGGDEWGWTAYPTPGESNATAIFAENRLAAPIVSEGSRLFTGTLNVTVDIPLGAKLMYTTDGSLPTAPKADGEGEEVNPWTQYVKNGDCEGTDASCFVCRDGNGNGDVNRITDGVGFNGSRGITVHSVANAANDWTTQFFIYTPDHIWKTGEKYVFRMKVRADNTARMTTQTHTTPHNYIYGSILDGSYNVTTEWQEISYTGTITDEQVGKTVSGGGWWGGGQETVTYKDMQTIAFNLNIDKTTDNNFYFDDISWELYTADGTVVEESSKESKEISCRITRSYLCNYKFISSNCRIINSLPF